MNILKRTKNVNELTLEMLMKESMITYNHMQEEDSSLNQRKKNSKYQYYILRFMLIACFVTIAFTAFVLLVLKNPVE